MAEELDFQPSGGVVLYAAQSNVQIDAEIAAHFILHEMGQPKVARRVRTFSPSQKGRFRTKTIWSFWASYPPSNRFYLTSHCKCRQVEAGRVLHLHGSPILRQVIYKQR